MDFVGVCHDEFFICELYEIITKWNKKVRCCDESVLWCHVSMNCKVNHLYLLGFVKAEMGRANPTNTFFRDTGSYTNAMLTKIGVELFRDNTRIFNWKCPLKCFEEKTLNYCPLRIASHRH